MRLPMVQTKNSDDVSFSTVVLFGNGVSVELLSMDRGQHQLHKVTALELSMAIYLNNQITQVSLAGKYFFNY